MIRKSYNLGRALRVAAFCLALATTLAWLALGANRGWTRTTRPVKTVDEVTGIEGIQYQKSFSPGLELLATALAGAGLLAASSFVLRNRQNQITN